MKNIFKILGFEYITCVKNKAFIITTVFIIVGILLMTFIPALISSMSSDSSEQDPNERPVIGISSKVYSDEIIKNSVSPYYPGHELKISNESIDSLKEKVSEGSYTFAINIDSPLRFTYITEQHSITDQNSEIFSECVRSMFIMNELQNTGISPKDSSMLLNAAVSFDVVATGKDQTKDFMPVYFLMISLFAAIATYGQLVAQSVVSEKNTRTMELLITCAKPRDLIFGKVIGSGLAGLTQLTLILATATTCFSSGVNTVIPREILEFVHFPVSTAIFALIFFILGYFIYAFLLGALASFASKSEDLSGLTTPIMFILMAVYFALVFLMMDSLDSTAMVVLSYIPFSAPLAMLIRATLTDIAVWEIVVSIVIQIVSVYLLGLLAGAIYKIGVLMYGNPPKPLEIIKMVLRKDNSAVKETKEK